MFDNEEVLDSLSELAAALTVEERRQVAMHMVVPGEYVDNAGEVWASIVNPADRFRFQKSIQDLLTGNSKIHDMSYRALDKTGEYVVCSCKGFLIDDDEGKPVYFAGTIDNHGIATEYDPITNLYTRYKLLNDLKEYQERKEKYMILMVGALNLLFLYA